MICHINLAKGFRGGERQTILLVNELARKSPQRLIVRRDSPMIDMVSNNVEVIEIPKPYALNLTKLSSCKIIHAHETKGAHMAFFGHLFFHIPYFITRRVPFVPSNNFFNRLLYQNASCVFTLSRAIDQAMHRGFQNIKTTIIPSAITPLTTTTMLTQLKKRFSGKFLIVHIGALVDRHKGQAVLIDAARIIQKKYPNIHFIFVGEGEDEAYLKRLAEDLENTSFEGFQKNIGDYLELCDVFVFPSRNEGLGSTILDAMSFAKPIVATAVGGIVDLIQNGKNGLLIPADRPELLASAIVELYNNPSQRQQLALQAKNNAEKYRIEHLVEGYLPYYEQILSKTDS